MRPNIRVLSVRRKCQSQDGFQQEEAEGRQYEAGAERGASGIAVFLPDERGRVLQDVGNVRAQGGSVAHVHLRYLNPFPANLGEIIARFEKVLVPELNRGQLRMVLRAEFLVDAIGLNKIQGKPFAIREVVEKIEALLK